MRLQPRCRVTAAGLFLLSGLPSQSRFRNDGEGEDADRKDIFMFKWIKKHYEVLSYLIFGVLTTQTYAQAVISCKSDACARKGAVMSAFLIPPIGIGGILVMLIGGITGRTVIGVLGIICVLVGTLQMNFFYHCPHCKRDLPKRTLPKTCPYCKKPLD